MDAIEAAVTALLAAGVSPDLANRYRAALAEMETLTNAVKRAGARGDLNAVRIIKTEVARLEPKLVELAQEIAAHFEKKKAELVAEVFAK